MADGAVPRFYGSSDGSATLTDTGGHAAGTVVERDATPAHTVRIDGDLTCGTPIRT